MNAAVEAINFALTADSPREFLTCWREGDWATIRKEWPEAPESVIAVAPTQAEPTRIALDFKQATELLEMFGGEAGELTLAPGDGHSGKGLYAWYSELPEEGAEFLGVADDEAVPTPSPQAEPGEGAIAEVVQAAFSHCDSNGLVIEPEVVNDLVRFTIAALKSAPDLAAQNPQDVSDKPGCASCVSHNGASHQAIDAVEALLRQAGVFFGRETIEKIVIAALKSAQPSAPASVSPDLLAEILERLRKAQMFDLSGRLQKAIEAQPSAQAQAAPAVAAVLNEVRWWDHRGDTVEEHYDEIHGAGAFERVVALASQPSAAATAREPQDAAFEAVRQRLRKLPRYSFLLSAGAVRSFWDVAGRWIEFDAAHELFDPVAVDAAIAAQAAAKGKA